MTMEERLLEVPVPPISDEHITKLEIKKGSIILMRVPINMTRIEGAQAISTIRKVIHEKTGINPGVLLVVRDCELASLNIPALNQLKAEIDATIQYHYSKQGGSGGN